MVAKIIHQIWQIFLVEEVEIGVGRMTKIHFSQSVMYSYFHNGNVFF